MSQFETIQQRCRQNLLESVIPFWMRYSPDAKHGGTYTCLDADGTVYDTKKYIWLQGRSVWMFSRLYNQQEKNPAYLESARLGMDFLERYAVDASGKYYFSLTEDGRPYFFQRKVYSAVFCMLAYLEYGKAVQESSYIQRAADLFNQIRRWIQDTSLLGRPVYEGLPKTSGLADVMVLASMAIELAAVDPRPDYRQIMEQSIRDVRRHYDPDKRILLEQVALDGTDLSGWPEGRLFNPGHSIEVAWFLLHLLEFVPDEASRQMALDVIEGSLEYGWDTEQGGIYYFMDIQHKPTLQLESSMKLWWPHTEAMYALSLAYVKTRDQRWLEWLEKVTDYAFDHFVDTQHGGWFGYCDRSGHLTHMAKGGNYKGFFHVPRALLMISQLGGETAQ